MTSLTGSMITLPRTLLGTGMLGMRLGDLCLKSFNMCYGDCMHLFLFSYATSLTSPTIFDSQKFLLVISSPPSSREALPKKPLPAAIAARTRLVLTVYLTHFQSPAGVQHGGSMKL